VANLFLEFTYPFVWYKLTIKPLWRLLALIGSAISLAINGYFFRLRVHGVGYGSMGLFCGVDMLSYGRDKNIPVNYRLEGFILFHFVASVYGFRLSQN
jgi:hypothetical protein